MASKPEPPLVIGNPALDVVEAILEVAHGRLGGDFAGDVRRALERRVAELETEGSDLSLARAAEKRKTLELAIWKKLGVM